MKTKLKFLFLSILVSLPFAIASAMSHDLSDVLIIFGAIWGTMALMTFVLPVNTTNK